MAKPFIQIDKSDFTKVKIKLPETDKRLMTALGYIAVKNYKQRMNAGLGIDDQGNLRRHPPNSPATIEKKGSDIPLIDTGLMRDSFRVDLARTNKSRAVLANVKSERGGFGKWFSRASINNAELAVTHQYGIGVPKRPHIGISKKDQVKILKYLNKWSKKTLKEVFKK